MGSSDVIKVDTEQLRTMAGDYTIRSNSVDVAKNNNSGTIQTIVYRMPAYDGRLQQAAKGDILDFNKRADDFSNSFKEDSASLINIAEAFEEVDGETIKIFQQADDMTRASQVDAINNFGLKTTITTQEIDSPPNVLPKTTTTITVVRTINADGTITYRTTIVTVLVVDADTARIWNNSNKTVDIWAGYIGGTLLAASIAPALIAAGVAAGTAAAIAAWAGVAIDGAQAINETNDVWNPERGWQAGDTITNTATMVTVEQPVQPYNEPPAAPDITNNSVVTDSQGKILSEDTTGIDQYGNLKP